MAETEERNGENIEKTEEKITYSKDNRLALIDNLRGMIILLAAVFGLLYFFDFMPPFFRHYDAYTNGIGIPDIGVVAFTFILSLMTSYNFRRRMESGKSCVRHYINRGLILMGIGFLIGYFVELFNINKTIGTIQTWNILVTYGAGTMLMLPFLLFRKPEIRFFSGLMILLLHQVIILRTPALSTFIIEHDQGGIAGVFCYLGAMLLSAAVGEFYFIDKKRFHLYSSGIVIVGLMLILLNATIQGGHTDGFSNYIYLNKINLTAGYIIVSLAVTLVIFISADCWIYFRQKQIPLVGNIGQSTLFYYVLSGGLTQLAFVIIGKSVENMSMVGGTVGNLFLGLAVVFTPILIIAWLFEKYKIRISI